MRENTATYDRIAGAYAERWSSSEDWWTSELDWLADRLGEGATVGDLGCGPGLHAAAMRRRGLRAVGLDLSAGMLRSAGVPGLAQADMRALPLRDGALDAVWCAAALLHIPREGAAGVLREFARVLRPDGGLAMLSVAEGEGEYVEAVSYRPELRRNFVLYGEEELTGLLDGVGLRVEAVRRRTTHRSWLHVRARSWGPVATAPGAGAGPGAGV